MFLLIFSTPLHILQNFSPIFCLIVYFRLGCFLLIQSLRYLGQIFPWKCNAWFITSCKIELLLSLSFKIIQFFTIRRVGGVPEGGRTVLPREAGAHSPNGRVQQAQDHPAAQEIDLLHCFFDISFQIKEWIFGIKT